MPVCSVEVREGFPIKASCVHRVDLHSVLADLVLGLRNKDCKKLTEHKFNSLVEDLLTVDLSCHTLFPFSSNYSAVRQSHCKAAWEINPCVQLLENLCVGFLWHQTHFHVNVNHVFYGVSNQVSSTQLARQMCLRERIFFLVFWHNTSLHQQMIIS